MFSYRYRFLTIFLTLLDILMAQLVLEQPATCHNDPAIYTCTNNQSGVLSVTINIVSGGEKRLIFNRVLTPEGTIQHSRIGSTPAIYNVTILNDSYSRVSIKVTNLVDLVGSTIECSMESLVLDYTSRNSNHSFSPLTISLRPYNDTNMTSAFIALLGLPKNANISESYITFSPQPIMTSMTFIENTSVTYFHLNNNTLYNISVSWTACPGACTSTFSFGLCPLILDTISDRVLHYDITSDNVSALVKCNHYGDTAISITCGKNGEWSRVICSESNQGSTTTITTISTKEIENPAPVGIPVYIFIAVICTLIVISLIILSAGIPIIMYCSKRSKNITTVTATHQLPEKYCEEINLEPLYEELDEKHRTVDVSKNIAYESLPNSSNKKVE